MSFKLLIIMFVVIWITSLLVGCFLGYLRGVSRSVDILNLYIGTRAEKPKKPVKPTREEKKIKAERDRIKAEQQLKIDKMLKDIEEYEG